MRRWILAFIITALIIVGAGQSRAQDQTPVDRIRAAYDAYKNDWGTFQVKVREKSDYALTAQGDNVSMWQRQERDIQVGGWYDQSKPEASMISLNIKGNQATSTNEMSSPSSWKIDLNAALVAGKTFWRGSYTSDPTQDFTLPSDWETFTSADVSTVPMLLNLSLNRYLRQEDNVDPFVGDYQAWLDAADTIVGPTPVYVTVNGQRVQGDLYEIELPLSSVKDALSDRLPALIKSANVVSDQDALLKALLDNGKLTWSVVLDSNTGQLLAQKLVLDISATMLSGLVDPYQSLKVEFSSENNATFSGVNEAVDTSGLPSGQ